MKSVLACLLLLLALPLHATDVTVSCTPTMTYTDGSAIPALTPITFSLYGSSGGAPLTLLAANLPACTTVRTNVDPGLHQYAYTETVGGLESAQSAATSFTVTGPTLTPAAPGAPVITVSVPTAANTVYSVIRTRDTLVVLPVGTVPPNTVCDPTQGVLANNVVYFLVPIAAATFSGTTKPVAVVARCS